MKNYRRKTQDEYQILGFYSYGLEVVTTEESWAAAKIQLKCYRENEKNTAFKILKKRVKIEVKNENN